MRRPGGTRPDRGHGHLGYPRRPRSRPALPPDAGIGTQAPPQAAGRRPVVTRYRINAADRIVPVPEFGTRVPCERLDRTDQIGPPQTCLQSLAGGWVTIMDL